VTADHGISFRGGERVRGVSQGNVEEILWTPLFVKAPGQQDGEIVDHPARSIDVVPTIAEMLGVDLPWEVDGLPLGEPRPPSYDRPRTLDWSASALEADDGDYVTVDGGRWFAEMLRERRTRAEGDPELRVYRRGPYGNLVGREIDDLDVGSEAPFRAEMNSPGPEPVVDDGAESLPIYHVGKLPGGPRVELAVAVNGVIGIVTDVYYPFGPAARIFVATVPEQLLREGRNEIELYLVEGGASPTLHPIPTVRAPR
jgi:hypothetical protein